MGAKPAPVMERFLANVSKGEPDACWPWTGYCDPNGYGRLMVGGKRGTPVLAHRLALFGENCANRPEVVMHTCDNPPCCNPAHLRPGTQLQNLADAKVKGHSLKKLSAQQVRDLTAEAAALPRQPNGRVKYGEKRKLAARYGITHQGIEYWTRSKQ